jgi:hypothetical protein
MSESDNLNRKHPASTFEAEYPYNSATVTRSGHEIHLNDTPEKESIKIAHTKGSYLEIDRDGNLNHTIMGRVHIYAVEGSSESVDGHKDVFVGGSSRTNVLGSEDTKISENSYLGVGGNYEVTIGGAYYNHVNNSKYESIEGDYISSVSASINQNINGYQATRIGKGKTEIIGNSWWCAAGENIELNAENGVFKVYAQDIELVTPFGSIKLGALAAGLKLLSTLGNIELASSGSISSNSAGPTAIKASIIDLN